MFAVTSSTAIELAAFTAIQDENHVLVQWLTAHEVDHAGFNILRSQQEQGPYERLNEAPITGEGVYEFLDESVAFSQVYYYKIESVSVAGLKQPFGPINVRVEPPHTFSLLQNYPNPFNPETTIEFSLPQAAQVTLKVYNLLGREVATLIDAPLEMGFHRVVWDGRNNASQRVASGLYLYRIQADDFEQVKKMVLVK